MPYDMNVFLKTNAFTIECIAHVISVKSEWNYAKNAKCEVCLYGVVFKRPELVEVYLRPNMRGKTLCSSSCPHWVSKTVGTRRDWQCRWNSSLREKSPSQWCKPVTAQKGIPLNVETEGITITVISLPPYRMYFRTRLPYIWEQIKGKIPKNFENLDNMATFMLYVYYASYKWIQQSFEGTSNSCLLRQESERLLKSSYVNTLWIKPGAARRNRGSESRP